MNDIVELEPGWLYAGLDYGADQLCTIAYLCSLRNISIPSLRRGGPTNSNGAAEPEDTTKSMG